MLDCRTIVDILRARADRQPDRQIYTFLQDGEAEAAGLTFAGLDRQARTIGGALRGHAGSGDRVLLVLPPGLDFVAAFFGCLYAGVIAVPAYPPQSLRHLPRLLSIVEDAEPSTVLTSAALLPRLQKLCAGAAGRLASLRWIAVDLLPVDLAAGWEAPPLVPESPAFLQYTSGSTAAPKGVMVGHGNLVHNAEMIRQAFGQSEDSVVVGWLPLYHDMGLIGNVLQPLYAGGRCILMSPMAFLQRPARWLEAVARYRATTSGGPDFAYELCVRKVGEEARAGLDLSSWQVAFSGAEPVRAATLARFTAAFARCGFRREAFYPCYGLAEATLFVSGGLRHEPPRLEAFAAADLEENRAEPAAEGAARRELVSCGQAWMAQQIAIADPATGTRCAPGRVGEIWISGPSVALGYWGRPEATERDFRARLAGEPEAGPFLRTGDLGFLAEGDLFVTGRLKDLIILRGRNHYPQDLELAAERSHPALRPGCSAAFSVEAEGEERLVLVCEAEGRSPDAGEAGQAIRQALAEEHEVRVHEIVFLRAGTIPKTSSGKVQRRACRAGYLDGSLTVLGRSGLVREEALAGEPPRVLGRQELLALPPGERPEALLAWLGAEVARLLEVPPSRVPAGTPLTALGLDSLAAVELGQRLAAGLGVEIGPSALLAGADLAGLAREVLERLGAEGDPTGPAGPRLAAGEPAAEGPLSAGQKALWFLHRLAPEGGADRGTYHIAAAVRVRPAPDAGALRRTFEDLARRHPALRATFHEVEGEPRQRVHAEPRLDFVAADAAAWSDAELRRRLEGEAYRPFDLEAGPLLRAGLFRRSAGEAVVLLAVHHLVADFWTLAVLARELGDLYAAHADGRPAALAPVPVAYADWVRWLDERMGGPEGARLQRYWESRLAGAPSGLELPADRPRTAAGIAGDAGSAVLFRIDPERARALRAVARSQGATPFTALLALLQALLHRTTGRTDVTVGSPVSGRSRPELAALAGYLVNVVVLRGDLSGAPGFAALLEQVRSTVLEAFEHQDYPFPLLAEKLAPGREAGRAPLVQVALVLQKAPPPLAPLGAFAVGEPGVRLALGGLELESLPLEERFAQFDLTLRAAELEEGIAASFLYRTDLFDAPTMVRMAGHFAALLAGAVAEPDRSLGELPLLAEGERHQLLAEWNDTAAAFPGGPDSPRVHELVEAQAQLRPEAVAVVQDEIQVTYAELERRAAALAHHLRSLGIRPEEPIGLCAERSPELVLGALAVWKAGGAYVPLDPAYPAEHLGLVIADTAMPVVLAQRRLVERLPVPAQRGCRIVLLDGLLDETAASAAGTRSLRVSRVSPLERAYVIYTSGSTGRPKGVEVSHGALLNLVSWHLERYPAAPGDRASQVAGLAFDATVWELWPYLAAGAAVHLAGRDETRWEPRELRDWLVDRQVRFSFLPTPLAEAVLRLEWPRSTALEVLLTGGDKLVSRPPAGLPFRLVNNYGPTENTVVATCGLVGCLDAEDGPEAGRPPSIGRPVPNVEVLLLDPAFQPVPAGIAGELCLGGASLARGYLGRPERTAERFVPHPWSARAGERLYRTGDLARRRAGGEIEFLGRIDQQVKIRGFRIEPGDIEAALLALDGVREAVVVARQESGDRRLVAYVVGDAAAAELRRSLRRRLPEHMIPAFFVALPELPLTPNGKVDRRALPAPQREPVPAEPAGLATPVEELLAGIWAEVLGLERVGRHESFFDLGGHSLLATRVLARVQSVLGVELPVRTLFERSTVAELATAVEAARRSGTGTAAAPPLVPVPRSGDLPLSFAQERLWFLDRLAPGNPAYNVPLALHLRGRVPAAGLAGALAAVAGRHEALRATFTGSGGRPAQEISSRPLFPLAVIDLTGLPAAARPEEAARQAREEARRAFDLAAGPLCRAALLCLDGEEHLLVLDIHHIVFDGGSADVLLHELGLFATAAATGEPPALPPLPVQYADFAIWQRGWLDGGELAAQLGAWRERLAGAPAALDLPADRRRPAAQTFRGGAEPVTLPEELVRGLRSLGRRRGATLFMTVLAGWAALLHRASGAPEVLVGTPVANRRRPELEGLIGLFVNTLPLRVDLTGDPPFAEVLDRVRETALAAYENQDVPFERLVEVAGSGRDLSRSPLFQAMLALADAAPRPLRLPGVTAEEVPLHNGTAKLELLLALRPAGNDLSGGLEFNADLFDAATARRQADQLVRLLAGAAAGPELRLGDLPLLTAAEERQILVDWNATEAPFPRHLGLHELVEAQAARTPEETALIHGTQRLSYRELDAWAGRLARRLRALDVGPEVLVGVFCGRTPGMVAAALAVLKAGGAYLPLDPAYPADRLSFLLADSGAPVVLAEEGVATALPAFAGTLVPVDRDAGGDPGGSAAGERPRGFLDPAQAAYAIYTSGSTGVPKGVLVRHGSAVARITWALSAYPREVLAGVLAATSLCFDLSVFEIFVPLAAGGAVILAEDALALPGLPAASAVTLVNTVPSAMAELVRAGALPRSVRVVNLAGEPLRRDLAARLYALEGVEEVYNLYGPTEDTTYSTGARVERSDEREPAIGRPLANTRAYLLDPGLRPVPVGTPGELWLGGEGVARGYLRRPDSTAGRFRPDPFGPPSGRLYRTGDLARRRPDGALEYLGRLDHQVKIRGFRIELGEIEAALAALEGVREAVVVAREEPDRRLVAYVVGDVAADALSRSLRERLPGYMVPLCVTLAALPLTPNGKVDRKALPAPEPPGPGGSRREPRTPVEEILAGIWAEVLGVPEGERVGADGHFFDLGGHSLLAARVMSRLRDACGVEMPLRDLFEAPTLAGFAARVEAVRQAGAGRLIPSLVRLAPELRENPLPLSFAQQRLWLIDQLEPGPLYNITAALRATGPLDPAVLALCLGEIVRRHEALRTVFAVREGSPVQVIRPAAPFELAVADLSGLPGLSDPSDSSDPSDRSDLQARQARALAAEEAARPFDLSHGPLLRGVLLRLVENDQIIVLTLHHIAGDGWSMGILVRELTALYAAFTAGRPSPLAELPVQYADFSAWQHAWLHGEILESEISFWRRQLAGLPPRLELPTDRPRPAARSFRGAARPVRLPAELTRRLQTLSRREGATLFMVLLAGFQALLARWSGQQDLAVGAPVAGRDRVEIEGLIGFFVNTLVLRGDLSELPDGGGLSFRELLGRVRETAFAAHAHQDVPFERLVQELAPERSLAHTPLFQVMLALQSLPMGSVETGSLGLSRLEVDPGTAKFDLSLTLEESGGELAGALRYAADLFDATTALRLVGQLERLLAAAAAAPEQSLAELEIFSAAERAQLLVEWNDTARGVPALPVHRLFAERAERHPGAVAVRTDGDPLTYGELAARVRAWAGHLRALGAGPEQVAAVCLERSADLVAALLAVLTSGAAYLPLDPRDPEERRVQILADARPLLLLTRRSLIGGSEAVRTVCVEDLPAVADTAAAAAAAAPGADGPAGALAYVLYTSGSTGRPKGVAVDHTSLSGYLAWIAGVLESAGVRWLPCLSSVTFDASLKQLFAPLLRGEAVRVISEDALLRPARLLEILGEAPGAGCNTVPALWEGLLGALERGDAPPPADLRALFLGGERLPEELVARTRRLLPGVAIHNLYGPTEATANAAWARLGEAGRVVLGRPVGGAHIVLADRDLRPVPLGAAGELCVGGTGVARGYRERPGLTAERFVPDPFGGGSGARLYRTGDLARRLPDGSLDFLGRTDDQVKVRGFRIELGEIEAVLGEHPGVRAAAVLARADGSGERRLVAYVAAGSPPAPGASDLRAHLERKLPAWMVPAAFQVLAELPWTQSGKIDRAALAALADPVEEREGAAMPETPLEKVLAGMVAEILGLDRVGIHDNFFELGGHSMKAVELIGSLRDAFGIDLPLFYIFDAPTVSGLAGVLSESPEWSQTVEELAPALLQLIAPPGEPVGSPAREETR